MTSMVMLDITMEVSINKEFPLKGGPKLGLGTSALRLLFSPGLLVFTRKVEIGHLILDLV